MKKIKIGFDKFTNKDIYKIRFSADEIPDLSLFNSEDVITGNPNSNIAIGFVYTWKDDRPPENILEFFRKVSNYAAITGLWRTTNGAKYVFSNILKNPNINKLVILVFDSHDNGHLLVDSLVKFWKNGIDDKGIIVGTEAPNPKFEGVSPEALSRLKRQVDLVVMKNIKDSELENAEELVKAMYQEPENARNIKEFKNADIYSVVDCSGRLYDCGARFDSQFSIETDEFAKHVKFEKKEGDSWLGNVVYADNLSDALESATGFIFRNGQQIKDQRGVVTVENRSISIVIKNVLEKIPEGFSEEYMKKYVDEFMYGKGSNLEEFAYTYHKRIFKTWGNQVEKAIQVLKKSNETRRVIISLWDPEEDLDNTNPPCLNFIWVVVRNNKLELHVVYRSHHIATVTSSGKLVKGEGAFVPNIYAIGTLQKHIASEIGIKTGSVVITDFSGHLYVSGA